MEVLEPRALGGAPPLLAHQVPGVRPAVGVRENPLALGPFELTAEQLERRATENHGPRPALRPRQQDDALLQMHHLPAQTENLRQAHQGQRCEPRDRAERLGHRLEDENLLLRPQPPDPRVVLGKERAGREVEVGAEIAIDGGRLRRGRRTRGLLLGIIRSRGEARALRPGPAEGEDVGLGDPAHRLGQKVREQRPEDGPRLDGPRDRLVALPPGLQVLRVAVEGQGQRRRCRVDLLGLGRPLL